MFGIILALFLLGLLLVIVRFFQEPEDKNPILSVFLVGYFLRFFVRTFNRNLVIFSDGQTLGGGDAVIYEQRANWVIERWHQLGVHFVTSKEMPCFYDVSLPPNLFAFVGYLNNGYSAIGYLSIVAFLACLTAFILYRTYIVFDPESKVGFYAMCMMFFCPSFVAFTSDSFKEGLIIFFVVSIFSIFIHLNRQNFHLLIPTLIFCFVCLEGTRFYLVYALFPSGLVWSFWLYQKKIISLKLGLFFAFIVLLGVFWQWSEILHAFNIGYSKDALASNMAGSSGVNIYTGKSVFL